MTESDALPASAAPLDAALWLVAHHLDYIRGVEGPVFVPWCERAGELACEQVQTLARGLVRVWVDRARACLDVHHTHPSAWTRAAIRRVRATILDAWRAPLHASEGAIFPDHEDPHYFRMAGARLLRGTGSCDGMNDLLARLLCRFGEAELVDVGSHRLVRLPSFAGCPGPVFVDAYTDLPPFVLGPATGPSVRSDEEVLAAAHARRAKRAAAGQPEGEEPMRREDYAQAAVLHRYRGDAPQVPWPSALPVPDLRDRPRPNLAVAYYVARAHDLFGQREHARRIYSAVIQRGPARGPQGLMYAAASQFSKLLDDPLRPETSVQPEHGQPLVRPRGAGHHRSLRR